MVEVKVKNFPVRYLDNRYLAGDEFVMNKEHVNDSLVEIIGEVETDISKMTVAELKEFAATKGIDLTGVDKKDEILTVIQSHIEPDEQEQ
ncbi:hypothetical protein BEP19_09845 [Ammoniphilus oxalaticus]|uniref:SAP domain-containing protein n=2 Tax=Ammoniphilus oxalaticus TaxID=66863 RepID=A0A419SFI7_9BACL|nr:hypothetical protein BEP19_09845 [Ammoniphilus oxalaticus]